MPKDMCFDANPLCFETDLDIKFTVTEGVLYTQEEIALAHQNFFDLVPEGFVVSVNFWGQGVPTITRRDGAILRLSEVIVRGVRMRKPQQISNALKLRKMRDPSLIFPIRKKR